MVWYSSKTIPGVEFAVRRVSLAGRIELTSRIRELCRGQEFKRAGGSLEQLDAAVTDLTVKSAYIDWGLSEVRNLRVQGRRIRTADAVCSAPECLTDEILGAIKSQLGLTEDERKNF